MGLVSGGGVDLLVGGGVYLLVSGGVYLLVDSGGVYLLVLLVFFVDDCGFGVVVGCGFPPGMDGIVVGIWRVVGG